MIIRKGILIAGLTAALSLVACGTDDDTATPTPTATATATPDDGTVAITFKVNTATTADGTNTLASVLDGETVYIVGDFEGGCNFDEDPNQTCWKPQSPNRAMTAEGGGIWAITIDLVPGTELQYKWVKTTDDPTNNGWGNGVKDYIDTATQACPGFETTGGLWEITNQTYTVPDAAATVATFDIDAWRDYATATYGYPSCD